MGHSLFSLFYSLPQLPCVSSHHPGLGSWLLLNISAPACKQAPRTIASLLQTISCTPLCSIIISHRPLCAACISVSGFPTGLAFYSVSPTQDSPQTFATLALLKLGFHCAPSLYELRWLSAALETEVLILAFKAMCGLLLGLLSP